MRKIWPVLLLVVGVAVFGVAVALGVGGFADSLRTIGQPWTAPASSTQQLSAGTYVVFEQNVSPTLGSQDVTVTGPTGVGVPVTATISSTLTLGSTSYVGIAGFTAPQDGTYTIDVAGDGQQLVLGPELGATIGSAFLWVGVAMLGGFLALAGAVWFVVALIVGSRNPQPAGVGPGVVPLTTQYQQPQAPATPQGAWYPDPQDPTQLRWWDGRQWTEDRHPR